MTEHDISRLAIEFVKSKIGNPFVYTFKRNGSVIVRIIHAEIHDGHQREFSVESAFALNLSQDEIINDCSSLVESFIEHRQTVKWIDIHDFNRKDVESFFT